MTTLLDVLRRRAESPDGSRPALHFRTAAGWDSWTWADYYAQALRAGAGLRARGIAAGDAVLVLAVESQPAVRTLFGAWAVGAVPTMIGVPLRLDDLPGYVAHVGRLAERLGAKALVVPRSLLAAAAGVEAVPTIVAEDLDGDPMPPDGSCDTAIVQLTSGSTAAPRGVVVRHDGLMRHLAAMSEALPVARPGAVGVTWLPLYHDMGLIGGLLLPLFTGFEVRMSSPATFRANPFLWLRDLSEFSAAMSPAPPSAWGLCRRLAGRAAAMGLDFSALACALVGAEPISARVLSDFADAFAPCGFRSEAFFPVYGLAEATLAVTFPGVLASTRIDTIGLHALADGHARAPAPGEASTCLVGVGRPLPGTRIRIVDARGRECEERRVGRILVASDSLMAGYHDDPQATATAIVDGWLHTGDLGYVADGELFVTGREKETIIRGGCNLVPSHVEEIAGEVAGVRQGCVAAVGVWDDALATQRAIVIAETRQADPTHDALARAVRSHLETHGIKIDEIRIAPAGTLPRTTSGKLARVELARSLAAEQRV